MKTMKSIPLVLPSLGDDAATSGEIISLSAAGTALKSGDIYMEVETDKVVVEVPADADGVISCLAVSIGDTVTGGDNVGELKVEQTGAAPAVEQSPSPPETEVATEPTSPESAPVEPEVADVTIVPPEALTAITAAGPAARRLARRLGVDVGDVKGSGAHNRVTKEDVTRHAKELISAQDGEQRSARPSRELPDIVQFGPVSQSKLSGIAKATSRNMQFAWSEIPHAWVQEEIDITELESLRKQVKAASREPLPLTVTAILCKVVALALKKYPEFNAVLDTQNEQLILRDYINIGVAVDTPRGLVVPGLRKVDELNALQIGHELKDLSDRAKATKLVEKDFQGNGFTLSNLGGIGVSGMFPVVNWPEVAILGVSSSREQCLLREGQVTNQLMMPLTLGFDHRVINGADAARFLGFIKKSIEQPATLLINT
jgi:pyruvate dehydrogenase E2 component (dihydrolipoamide acetyltransferase)